MQYNLDMKEILGDNGISVIEIPRKKCGEDVISASKVRRLLDARNYALLEKYIPETTMSYVVNNTMKPVSTKYLLQA